MDAIKKKGLNFFILVTLFSVGLAQLGSYLVETNLRMFQSVKVLPFMHFTHVRNMGGVFGLFQGKGWIFTIVSIIFLGLLCFYIWRETKLRLLDYICCGFILGGGMSNILDRIIYGSVIDFIEVIGIPYWNYIFNTADALIHLGIWPMLIFGSLNAHKQQETQASVNPTSDVEQQQP